jgi:hypothetical protein
MGEQFIRVNERRAFTRLALRAPVQVRQGKSVWELELIDLPLTGLAVTEPDDLSADYARPFTFNLTLEPVGTLELKGHLIHMDPGCIGFDIDYPDDAQLNRLAQLLSEHLGAELIKQELALL